MGARELIIRPAQHSDAEGVAAVLGELVAAGKRRKPSHAEFALSHYIAHPNRIQCHVATTADGKVLGFQSLKKALDGNPYGAPVGWGLIGTHISPRAARQGVGKSLFEATLQAAQASGVPAIEAFIGAANLEGQAYYEAMGFRDYRTAKGAICKAFALR